MSICVFLCVFFFHIHNTNYHNIQPDWSLAYQHQFRTDLVKHIALPLYNNSQNLPACTSLNSHHRKLASPYIPLQKLFSLFSENSELCSFLSVLNAERWTSKICRYKYVHFVHDYVYYAHIIQWYYGHINSFSFKGLLILIIYNPFIHKLRYIMCVMSWCMQKRIF